MYQEDWRGINRMVFKEEDTATRPGAGLELRITYVPHYRYKDRKRNPMK
jgi:hypothetical protein